MQVTTIPNGNLRISVEGDADRAMLVDIIEEAGSNDLCCLDAILEKTGWRGNSVLQSVEAHAIGALTDAPIVTDELVIDDDGAVTAVGGIWWFPDYPVIHFGQQLLDKGSVDFDWLPGTRAKCSGLPPARH